MKLIDDQWSNYGEIYGYSLDQLCHFLIKLINLKFTYSFYVLLLLIAIDLP